MALLDSNYQWMADFDNQKITESIEQLGINENRGLNKSQRRGTQPLYFPPAARRHIDVMTKRENCNNRKHSVNEKKKTKFEPSKNCKEKHKKGKQHQEKNKTYDLYTSVNKYESENEDGEIKSDNEKKSSGKSRDNNADIPSSVNQYYPVGDYMLTLYNEDVANIPLPGESNNYGNNSASTLGSISTTSTIYGNQIHYKDSSIPPPPPPPPLVSQHHTDSWHDQQQCSSTHADLNLYLADKRKLSYSVRKPYEKPKHYQQRCATNWVLEDHGWEETAPAREERNFLTHYQSEDVVSKTTADVANIRVKANSNSGRTNENICFDLVDSHNFCKNSRRDLLNDIVDKRLRTQFFDSHTHSEFLPGRVRAMHSYSDLLNAVNEVDEEQMLMQQCQGFILDFCKPDFIKPNWPSRSSANYGYGIEETLRYANTIGTDDNLNIFYGLGVHPTSSASWSKLKELFRMRVNIMRQQQPNRFVTLGEFGIDFCRLSQDHYEHIQKIMFGDLLDLTRDINELPMQLHVRNRVDTDTNADKVALTVLAQRGMLNHCHQRHCFTGTVEGMKMWRQATGDAAYFGFTNAVFDTKRYPHLYDVVRECDLDRIVVETDAPFFTPPCYTRNSQVHPGHALLVAKFIANAKKQPIEEVVGKLTENFCRLYKINKPKQHSLNREY